MHAVTIFKFKKYRLYFRVSRSVTRFGWACFMGYFRFSVFGVSFQFLLEQLKINNRGWDK
jgi:hypothetical protein